MNLKKVFNLKNYTNQFPTIVFLKINKKKRIYVYECFENEEMLFSTRFDIEWFDIVLNVLILMGQNAWGSSLRQWTCYRQLND